MSYQVFYGNTKYDIAENKGAGIRLLLLSGSFFLIFGMLTVRFWPQGREVLLRLMEAGKNTSVPDSLEALAREIHMGIPVGEAVTAFCRDVMIRGLGQ